MCRQCRHGRDHPGSNERSKLRSGLKELRSAPMKDTENHKRVKGTPGEGGVPKANGQRVAKRKGPHGQILEKPSEMGQKKAK